MSNVSDICVNSYLRAEEREKPSANHKSRELSRSQITEAEDETGQQITMSGTHKGAQAAIMARATPDPPTNLQC